MLLVTPVLSLLWWVNIPAVKKATCQGFSQSMKDCSDFQPWFQSNLSSGSYTDRECEPTDQKKSVYWLQRCKWRTAGPVELERSVGLCNRGNWQRFLICSFRGRLRNTVMKTQVFVQAVWTQMDPPLHRTTSTTDHFQKSSFPTILSSPLILSGSTPSSMATFDSRTLNGSLIPMIHCRVLL